MHPSLKLSVWAAAIGVPATLYVCGVFPPLSQQTLYKFETAARNFAGFNQLNFTMRSPGGALFISCDPDTEIEKRSSFLFQNLNAGKKTTLIAGEAIDGDGGRIYIAQISATSRALTFINSSGKLPVEPHPQAGLTQNASASYDANSAKIEIENIETYPRFSSPPDVWHNLSAQMHLACNSLLDPQKTAQELGGTYEWGQGFYDASQQLAVAYDSVKYAHIFRTSIDRASAEKTLGLTRFGLTLMP